MWHILLCTVSFFLLNRRTDVLNRWWRLIAVDTILCHLRKSGQTSSTLRNSLRRSQSFQPKLPSIPLVNWRILPARPPPLSGIIWRSHFEAGAISDWHRLALHWKSPGTEVSRWAQANRSLVAIRRTAQFIARKSLLCISAVTVENQSLEKVSPVVSFQTEVAPNELDVPTLRSKGATSEDS